MISRRSQVDEKRKARRAFLLIISSMALFLFLIFVGVGSAAKLAIFVGSMRNTPQATSDDKTPPGPPRMNNWDSLPKYTKADQLDISGYAEAESKIKIYNNDSVIGEASVGNNSQFSTRVVLSKGENYIFATATDPSDNEGDHSPAGRTIYDPDPPQIEIESPKDNDQVYEKVLTISGKTEAGASISIGDRVGVVQDDGSFTIKYTLSEGSNSITLTSVDQAGNQAEKSLTVVFTP
ncbi:MAG: hypothetical protein HY376_00970 [Candidatus Blackburnbacteria bacterium]|nr:hypothetical protein [Candidatus Blackburnbacteria bacterium]